MAVHEERVHRMGRFRVEHPGAVALRQDLGPPRVHQQGRVPGRQQPGRSRYVGVWQGLPGQIEQLGALFITESTEPQPGQRRPDLVDRQAGPARDVGGRRRPETA